MSTLAQLQLTAFDFAFIGSILCAIIVLITFIIRSVTNKRKMLFAFLLLLVFCIVWIELGVGLVGSSFGGS